MNSMAMTKTPASLLAPLHHQRRAKAALAIACDAINLVSLHYSIGPLGLARREARALGLDTGDLDILFEGLIAMVKPINDAQLRLGDIQKRLSIATAD
jgi:hypothetical protein